MDTSELQMQLRTQWIGSLVTEVEQQASLVISRQASRRYANSSVQRGGKQSMEKGRLKRNTWLCQKI